MLTLFNPKKRRSKKRSGKARSRRRRSRSGGRFSPCTKTGRRRFFKAASACRVKRHARSALLASRKMDRAWRGKDAYSPLFGSNPRRGRRRYRRSRNTSWIPSYANPMGLVSSMGSAFNMGKLSDAVPVGAGAIGNMYASKFITGFLPPMISGNKFGKIAISGVTAGLLSAAVGMVAPKYSKGVLLGGVIQMLTSAVASLFGVGQGMGQMMQGGYIPAYKLDDESQFFFGDQNANYSAAECDQANDAATATAISQDGIAETQGMGGLSDYLTQTQAADARQLGGLGDYLTESAAMDARPLG